MPVEHVTDFRWRVLTAAEARTFGYEPVEGRSIIRAAGNYRGYPAYGFIPISYKALDSISEVEEMVAEMFAKSCEAEWPPYGYEEEE